MLIPIASLAENIGGWSTFLLAWLGVLAFFGALLGVAQTREDGKRARTLDYLRRLYSQEFAPLNAQVMAFLRTGNGALLADDARLDPAVIVDGKQVEAAFNALSLGDQARITLVLNFYEELSCSCREGLLDKEVAEKMLLPVVETVWDRAEPLILQWRISTQEVLNAKKPNERSEAVKPEELMEEWEELVKAIRRKRKSQEAKEEKSGRSRSWVDTIQGTLRFDGPVVRWAGMAAALLVVVGLIAVGVTALTSSDSKGLRQQADAAARGHMSRCLHSPEDSFRAVAGKELPEFESLAKPSGSGCRSGIEKR